MNGISLLLLEKDMPGLAVRKVVCQGNGCAGTAYVTMENVRVPVKNIIGKLNKGFMVRYAFPRKQDLSLLDTVHHVQLQPRETWDCDYVCTICPSML
jgi:hypothetical protein